MNRVCRKRHMASTAPMSVGHPMAERVRTTRVRLLTRSFGPDAVARAAEHATATTVAESEETIRGQLAGILPDADQFEFRSDTERGTIRGRIDRSLTADELTSFNRNWVNVDAMARMHVRRILHNELVVRENFALLAISAPDRG